MAKWTINIYNQRIDKTKTVQRIGRNGIHYEYVMPLFSDPMYYYNEAIDVKSKKSPVSTYKNGKRPGQYQPIGDKRFFTYYQINKMGTEEWMKWLQHMYAMEDEKFLWLVESSINQVINNE